jgi:ABC-type hemin transport system substrate-binding protein
MSSNSSRLIDAIGRVHALARADARIVSLVPSVTELLFALGIGDRLVGRTGFCIHPKDHIRTVPKVGGTKSVDVDKIRDLAPTHLIVNID